MAMDFDDIKNKAAELADQAGDVAEDLIGKAKEAAPGVVETAQDMAAKVAEGAEGLLNKAKEAAPGVIETAQGMASDAKDFIETTIGTDLDGDGKVGKGE